MADTLSSITARLTAVAVFVLFSGATARAASPFEIVVLTDTEYVVDTQAWWPIFPAQTQWIVDNRVQENVVFVSHVGDAPHHPTQDPTEWDRVTDAMYRLDGLVPYAISPGNHDLEDPTGFAQRFGPAHLGSFDWYGGATSDGLNSWQTFSAGDYEFLHIAIKKDPGSSVLSWARGVIEANRGKPTIVTTHDYLDGSGRTTAGQAIWDGLVEDYPQVFMTLNGHDRTFGFRMVSTNSAGKPVLQMLQNYQDYLGPDGESKDSGYLRKMIFDPDNGKISVQTFSPTFTAQPYLTGDAHQFSYDVAFLPQINGGTLSPIFVTDAATCRTTGADQGFDVTPGPGGTALPLGWTAWQIAGNADTFTSARPIAAGDVASASATGRTLLNVTAPPAGSWGNQFANVVGGGATGQALASNPGGNGASIIQLKVTNGTGEPTSTVRLYYDLDLLWPAAADDGGELPGYSLFWSTTGSTTAGDWHTLGLDDFAGYKAWDIDLSVPLIPGADLYIRWADDNALTAAGEAGAENVWAIDNARVVMIDPGPPTPGDTNDDDIVDASDYGNLIAQFGGPPGVDSADFNGDIFVDLADFAIMRGNFGFGVSSPDAEFGATTPEPATLTVLALGGLAILRRHK